MNRSSHLLLPLLLAIVPVRAQTGLLPAGGAGAMTLNRPDASFATRSVVAVAGVTNVFTLAGTTDAASPGLALPAPVLAAEAGPAGIIFSWPAAWAGYRLEVSDALSPAAWRAAGRAAVLQGDRWQVVANPSAASRFFRIARPAS